MRMRISIIGAGYLGATHAACMAELGFHVLAVDNDVDKVALLSQGVVPFREPGLDDLVARQVASGRLRFTTQVAEAAAFADVHFICVGTPQVREGHEADVSAVYDVACALAQQATRDCLIVGKSTVPVGTAQDLATVVEAVAPKDVAVTVAWNPEFLREGHGIEDTLRPDRLVFGVTSRDAERALRQVYAEAISAGTPVHVTDPATAELAKVAANAFLATKISFINALAEVSEHAGADVVALADVLGDDDRIGRRFLDAGVGVAVATDFNPGSAPSFHLPLAMTLACTLQRMTPAEALKGATIVAARAAGVEQECGSLEPGKSADFAVVDAPDVNHWLYHFRANACVRTVARGRTIWNA